MPFADQMLAGASLMVIGMGVVFAFLVLLVFALKAMSLLAGLIGEVDGEPAGRAPATAAHTGAEGDQAELVAVITAAIDRFRNSRRS